MILFEVKYAKFMLPLVKMWTMRTSFPLLMANLKEPSRAKIIPISEQKIYVKHEMELTEQRGKCEEGIGVRPRCRESVGLRLPGESNGVRA